MGEAVNGPGGYFGRSLHSLDDCFFGGFGLESPYTIVWREHALSRSVLSPAVRVEEIEHGPWLIPREHMTDEDRTWFNYRLSAARGGRRSMFDELVEPMESVPSRGAVDLTLRLE